ncbi:hypothetical protein [Streptomyces sp900116325]|uniref:hypothetical protein n=1 Tax=Streptomyces sp. 900116325 TaxID=3154295 RepID=UPI0033233DB9
MAEAFGVELGGRDEGGAAGEGLVGHDVDAAVAVLDGEIADSYGVGLTLATALGAAMAWNPTGSLSTARAALPHLPANGGGRIVQISTYGGQAAGPGDRPDTGTPGGAPPSDVPLVDPVPSLSICARCAGT